MDGQHTLFVTDTTCRPAAPYNVREHVQMIGGLETPFRFEYGKKLPMPFEVAMKFLKHEGFVVEEQIAEGKFRRYTPPPAEPDPHQANRPFVLEDDQVVAKFEELTIEALIVRANMESGGEALKRQDGKAKLIAFLVERRRQKKLENLSSDEGEDTFTPPPLDTADEAA